MKFGPTLCGLSVCLSVVALEFPITTTTTNEEASDAARRLRAKADCGHGQTCAHLLPETQAYEPKHETPLKSCYLI